jgi:AbrB family looped-hinge helix DNA binding protein
VIELSRVRVKRKGQVTIPLQLRNQLGLEEGAILEITKENNRLILQPLPPLEPGEPVGKAAFKKILAELEERRRNWR